MVEPNIEKNCGADALHGTDFRQIEYKTLHLLATNGTVDFPLSALN